MTKTINPLSRPFYHRNDDDVADIAHVPRYEDYPPPDADIFSDCGKIDKAWYPHIVGVLDVLTEPSLWTGDDITQTWAVQQIYNLIIWLFSCEGDMPQLRQNSNNPCLLEQLVNGVWIPAFDFGLCLDKSLPKRDATANNEAIIQNAPVYQQTANDIDTNGLIETVPTAQNSPTDTDNEAKNKALCIAITEYINMVCEQWAYVANQSPPSDGNVGDFITGAFKTGASWVMTWVAFSNPITAPAAWMVRLAQAGTIATAVNTTSQTASEGAQLINDLRNASFNNGQSVVALTSDQKKELVCQLYNGLKDKVLTQANFNSAIQNMSPPDSVAGIIKNILLAIFARSLSYTEFIMVHGAIANTITATNDVPYPPNCNCEPPSIECGFDYTFATWDGNTVPDMTFYESVPFNAVPTVIPFIPMQNVKPATAWQPNYFVGVWAVSELPCNKPITVKWKRGNLNSGTSVIETFDGTDWVQRASSSIAVSSPATTTREYTWSNPDGITYMGARVKVTSTIPEIMRFKVG